MAPKSLSLVNQKLTHVRFFLRRYHALDTSDAGGGLEKGALLEGAVYHLACAYRHYLHELAEICGLKPVNSFTDERMLLDALEREGRYSFEVGEISELRTGSSWLNDMLSTYENYWVAPIERPVAKAFDVSPPAEESLIQAKEIIENPLDNLHESAVCWLESFESLITRQRQITFEC